MSSNRFKSCQSFRLARLRRREKERAVEQSWAGLTTAKSITCQSQEPLQTTAYWPVIRFNPVTLEGNEQHSRTSKSSCSSLVNIALWNTHIAVVSVCLNSHRRLGSRYRNTNGQEDASPCVSPGGPAGLTERKSDKNTPVSSTDSNVTRHKSLMILKRRPQVVRDDASFILILRDWVYKVWKRRSNEVYK